MKTTPYWLDEPHETRLARRTADPADVTVIGAGVTGCACALALAERGLHVRLHEARRVAAGASGRNGGFALRGGAMSYDDARATLGPETARSLWQLTETGLTRLAALAGDDFRGVGSLRLAFDDAERDDLTREFAALREDGFEVEWVDSLPKPLRALSRGVLHHPCDGALHPARWVQRLAARAAEAGVELVEQSRARPDDSDTPVVVAVDGLISSVLPELDGAVRPVRGQMLATEPLPERLYGRPHYARRGYDYWQQLPDGRLLVGGKRDASPEIEETSDEDVTPLIQSRLDELVVTLLGRQPRVTHRWAGVWGETPDRLPVVGLVPRRDNVWVAGGYSGHGNVLGLVCGELVARAVTGERPPELALFDPARFA